MSAGESISHVSDSISASVQTTAEATTLVRPPRKKREPVTTIEGFFARRAAKAPAFLKDLAESGIWQFDEADIQAAFESHFEKDKDFARTTQLMAAALREKEGRFMRPVFGFGERVIRARLAANTYFIGVDLEAMATPEEKLAACARALGARLPEPRRRLESANLLLAVSLWLHHAEGLDPRIAIDTVATTLGSKPSTRDRERAKLVWLGENPADARAVADLLAPSIAAASLAVVAANAAELRAAEERDEREAAAANVVRLERDMADLQEMVRKLETEVARLDEIATAARVHAGHDVAQIKARVAGLLDSQLRELVDTADEALGLEPPRVGVARENIEAIARELERQAAWLRS